MKPKKSRNAIITGSTQGIGLAIAHEFLERGHNVFICGRDEINLNKALKDLSVLLKALVKQMIEDQKLTLCFFLFLSVFFTIA